MDRKKPSSPAVLPVVVPVKNLNSQGQRSNKSEKLASPSLSVDEHKDESSLKKQDLKPNPGLIERLAAQGSNNQLAGSLHFSQFDNDEGFVVSIERLSREL